VTVLTACEKLERAMLHSAAIVFIAIVVLFCLWLWEEHEKDRKK
jgi:hypothetical protein